MIVCQNFTLRIPQFTVVMLTMSTISHMRGGARVVGEGGGGGGGSGQSSVQAQCGEISEEEMLLRYYLCLITVTDYWQFLIHYNNKRFNFASIFQSGRSMRR